MFPSSSAAAGLKRKLRLYAVSLLTLYTPGAAWGVILLRDSFDYTADSNLRDQVNPSGERWEYVGTGSAIAIAPAVGAGNLSYPGLPAPIGNLIVASNDFSASARIALAQSVSTETVYYSLLFKVSDITGIGAATTGSFFAGLNTVTGAGTSGPTVAAAGMLVRQDPDNPSAFNVGMTLTGATGEGRVFDAADRFEGDTLFLIASYTFNPGSANDIARLYVNPDLHAFASGILPTPSAEATGADVSTGSLTSLFLRSNTVEPQQILIDDLRVGTSALDVVPEPAGSWLALGACALVGATCRGGRSQSRLRR